MVKEIQKEDVKKVDIKSITPEIDELGSDLSVLEKELENWYGAKNNLTQQLNECVMNINRVEGAISYIKNRIKTKKDLV